MTTETALFAGGCFWCLQPPFDALNGVTQTLVGYAGGETEHPSYEEVCRDVTGHREVIQVTFDPSVVKYETIVRTFFTNIDPTDSGGQFADRGHSYTTAVYVADRMQREIAEAVKAELAQELAQPIMTEILDAPTFWRGEDYHQDYYKKNGLRYNAYKHGSGRVAKLDRMWGGQPDGRSG